MWLHVLQANLRDGTPYDASAWRHEVLNFTAWWARQPDSYATNPIGDVVALSRQYLEKYTAARGKLFS